MKPASPLTSAAGIMALCYLPFLYGLSALGLLIAIALAAINLSNIYWLAFFAFMLIHAIRSTWRGQQDYDPEDPLELALPPHMLQNAYYLTQQVAMMRRLALPDEIRLHATSIAHVYKTDRGKNILVLGAMAVGICSWQSLAGVIAHELGHIDSGDVDSGRELAHACGVMASVESACFEFPLLGAINPLVWALCGYHRLFLLVRAIQSREDERHADQQAIRVAGPLEFARVMVLIYSLGELPWANLGAIIRGDGTSGQLPENLIRTQVQRARMAQPQQWRDACQKALTRTTAVLDSHPCLSERLAAAHIDDETALDIAMDLGGSMTPTSELVSSWEVVERELSDRIKALI